MSHNFYFQQKHMTPVQMLDSLRRLHATEVEVNRQAVNVLVRKCLPPIVLRQATFNTGNHYEYTPYIVDESNVVVIDRVWFGSLSHYIQDLLKLRVKFELAQVDVPHPSQRENEQLRVVYQTLWDGFDYNVWYSPALCGGASGVKMMLLDDSVKQLMLAQQALPREVVSQIESMIEEDKQYFVRLSSTSGKNYTPLRPYTSANQIVSLLSTCKAYVDKEYKRNKPTYLILVPWNDSIDSRNEFRMFVVNRRVTAASPQRWGEIHNYSQDELEEFQDVLSNASFIQHVPHATFVADVYIAKQQCHLIELNAFGAHSGVSSSLFHWVEDFDLLHGKTKYGEFRYLSIINI